MSTLSDVTILPLGKSNFIKPMEMHYVLNGIKKKWDFVHVRNGVAIIIYNVTRQVLVCVKQFRPAIYVGNIPAESINNVDCKLFPPELGMSLEFCAGIIDKQATLEQIAKEEVLEETGYDVPVEKFEKVKVMRSGVGAKSCVITFYYVEVEDCMKVAKGGGLAEEGEFIEVIELTIDDGKKICDDSITAYHSGFLAGLLWFFRYKIPKLNII